jgi:lipopolysaccharide biosynthesis glycosyltransferase
MPTDISTKDRSNKSDSICVCFGLTSDMQFAAGVSILNFVSVHGKSGYDFLVYSDSKLSKLQTVLSSQGINIRVVKYTPPISWLGLYSSKAVAYFSPLVLSKFEIFNNLNDYKRVIWLDYDIVIKGELKDLISKGKFDFACLTSSHTIGKAFISPPKEVDPVILSKDGISAGVLAVTDSFPSYQDATKSLYETYLVHRSNLYYPEQAIFDVFLDGKDFNWLQLEGNIYCDLPENETAGSLILHAWGPNKFWNGRSNTTWSNFYRIWLGAGGSRFAPIQSKINGILRRLNYVMAVVTVRGFRISPSLKSLLIH